MFAALNVDVQLSSTWFKKIVFYFALIAASSVNVEPSATWSKSKVLASAQSSKTKAKKNQGAGSSFPRNMVEAAAKAIKGNLLGADLPRPADVKAD